MSEFKSKNKKLQIKDKFPRDNIYKSKTANLMGV